MNADPTGKQRDARVWLKARGAALGNRLTSIDKDLRRETTPLPRNAPDAAIVRENDEVLEAIRKTGRAELTHISAALERLDGGFYGICDICGTEIDAARLRAVPYATECAPCAK